MSTTRGAEHEIRAVMTADVAQAVKGLRDALLKVDRWDRAIVEERVDARKVEAMAARHRARNALKLRRAELDAVLLGEDDGGENA